MDDTGPAAPIDDHALAYAAASAAVLVTQLAASGRTTSGDRVVLPQGDVQVVAAIWEFEPSLQLPEHKHPYPRYGYILAGTIEVIITETGQRNVYTAGDFVLETMGRWHKGSGIGTERVKILIIDFVPVGESNVVVDS